MKKLLFIIVLSLFVARAYAADVGVSVSVGQPGFYGRIDIGNAPQPELVYPQPIIIQPVPSYIVQEPIYLHVPPGQAKHWKNYCGRYNACGQPVYFVRDRWYNNVYVPHYRAHHGEYRGIGHGQKEGRERGDGHGRSHSDREAKGQGHKDGRDHGGR